MIDIAKNIFYSCFRVL